MSDQPKPLYALCEEWPHAADDEDCQRCMLEKRLKEWDGWLAGAVSIPGGIKPTFTREQILGLPKGTGE